MFPKLPDSWTGFASVLAAQKCPKSFSFLFPFPLVFLGHGYQNDTFMLAEYLPTFFIMKRPLLWSLDYIIWYVAKNNNQNHTRKHLKANENEYTEHNISAWNVIKKVLYSSMTGSSPVSGKQEHDNTNPRTSIANKSNKPRKTGYNWSMASATRIFKKLIKVILAITDSLILP